jgi:glycerophosphoryl diester phosphodiesterase
MGAPLIAPGNTCESFDAALESGVNMIEFDVLPDRATDRLLLAHSYHDVAGRKALTLEAGLRHLAQSRFEDMRFNADLKLPGYELRVLEALREFGMLERTLISSYFGSTLATIRVADPRVRLGWSVPRVRHDPLRSRPLTLPPYLLGPLLLPARVLVRIARNGLPKRAATAIRAGRCDALMVHWRLMSETLLDAVATAGGELYVWTVDDLVRLRELEAMAVTGVITNDPRLFAELAA